ncbi:MAG: DUF6512 family protein [Minisyncoccia bacterium]
MKDRSKILKLEFFGFLFVVILGSLLHFTFELSQYSKVVAYFSAVNESTWEHLKLAFFPSLVFGIFEYFLIKDEVNNYLFAEILNLYLAPILIVIMFYGYLAIFQKDFFVWDIFTFVFAVFIGRFVRYKILVSKKLPGFFNKVALVLFIIIFVSFSLFTYFPPRFFLFKDPITGGYGILR